MKKCQEIGWQKIIFHASLRWETDTDQAGWNDKLNRVTIPESDNPLRRSCHSFLICSSF
jgi:hypothetical protein